MRKLEIIGDIVIELRPYQEKAVKAAIDYIRNNPGKHPVIGMPTGSGKQW